MGRALLSIPTGPQGPVVVYTKDMAWRTLHKRRVRVESGLPGKVKLTGKPKVVCDINRGRQSVFRSCDRIVNLSYRRTITIPLFRVLRAGAICAAISLLVLGNVAAPTTTTRAANSALEERQALEAQLKDLESQIDQYESQIASYQKQGSSLKNEVARMNANIAKINLQIKAVNVKLAELGTKIAETETKVRGIESDIGDKRTALSGILKSIYENEQASLVEVFLRSRSLSDFWGDVSNLTTMQDAMRSEIRAITDLRDRLKDEQEQLSLARADAETIRKYQETQRTETEQLKTEKNNLLAVTKGQESKYQTLLKQTKETAAQIRNRIFQILGGGELSFEQAYQFAKLAGNATGVRPAFIMAVLNRESALGQNVGRCTYKTAMNPNPKKQSDGSLKSDIEVFLDLVARLGLANPESIPVSCANADGAYGGAMGPAQFIPSTWSIFEKQIARVTGREPANPWNNGDAFVAAGLYLANAGAEKSERTAAAKYYCGSRWNRYVCTNVYAQRVVEAAAKFQRDIDTILE